jgi:hypothetical protein
MLRSRSSTTLSIESLRRDASHLGHFRPAAIPGSFQTGPEGLMCGGGQKKKKMNKFSTP